MEFGAVRVRQWQDGITHIVADHRICYQDILNFLELPSLPVSISKNHPEGRANLLRPISLSLMRDMPATAFCGGSW